MNDGVDAVITRAATPGVVLLEVPVSFPETQEVEEVVHEVAVEEQVDPQLVVPCRISRVERHNAADSAASCGVATVEVCPHVVPFSAVNSHPIRSWERCR